MSWVRLGGNKFRCSFTYKSSLPKNKKIFRSQGYACCNLYRVFTIYASHSYSSFILAFNMRLFWGTLRPRKVCSTPAWRRIITLKFYELNLQRVAVALGPVRGFRMRFSIWPAIHSLARCNKSCWYFAHRYKFRKLAQLRLAAWLENGTADQRSSEEATKGGTGVRIQLISPTKRACDMIVLKIGDDLLRYDPMRSIPKRSRAAQANNIKLIANMIDCALTWSFIANYMQNMPLCHCYSLDYKHGKLDADHRVAWRVQRRLKETSTCRIRGCY